MLMKDFIRRLALAALAGLCLELAFPGPNIWILSFVGVGLLSWALISARLIDAVLVGLISGGVLWLGLIRWLTLYLGPVPWLALGILQTLFFAMGTLALWFIINRLPRLISHTSLRVALTALCGAAVWASREVITASWPYGGFSWARLAQSQSESPLRLLVAWGGTAFLSFVVALLSLLFVEILRVVHHRKMMAMGWALLVVGLCAVPAPVLTSVGTTNVLAVQGNSKAGLFDNRSSGQILMDHVSLSLPYVGRSVDMVVWPENATDISPVTSVASAKILTSVSSKIGAPIVTGSVIQDPDGTWYNTSLVWSPTDGLVDRYDKIHPVPFAEYMPDRAFWRQFAPELIDLVGYDYRAGNRSPVVDVAGVPAGITICFDITSEQQLREMTTGGAQLILAQTNNADFGRTDENLQQLAITRLAAIETGRSIVNISTVGTSAVLSPTGTTLDSLPAYEPGAMLTTVPLTTNLTPAMLVAPFVDIAVIFVALAGLLSGVRWRRKP